MFEQVEMAVGELCRVVKETYGGDKGGFIAGRCLSSRGSSPKSGSVRE